MKFIKVDPSLATGSALDWLVAKGRKVEVWIAPDNVYPNRIRFKGNPSKNYSPSSDGSQGLEIMDEESISIIRCDDDYQKFQDKWAAKRCPRSYDTSTESQSHPPMIQFYLDELVFGPTMLTTAMRGYIASFFGIEVNLPEELLHND